MFYIALTCLPRFIKYLTFPPHYGNNAKVKTQQICPAIPHLAQGLRAVITNHCYIIYTEILKLQHQASNFGFLTSCKNSEWLFFSLAKDAGQLAFSLKKLELFFSNIANSKI